MFLAIRRLLFIALGVLFFTFSLVFMLRIIGQKMQYSNIDHPFLKWSFYLVAQGGGSEIAPPNTMKSFRNAVKLSDKIILSADLKMTADKVWVLYGERYLETLTNGKGLIERSKLTDLKTLSYKNSDEKIATLEEFLKNFSNSHLILNIQTTRNYDFNGLIDLLNKYQLDSNVVIRSTSSGVLREIRKVKPLWLFGADHSTLSKLSFFSSLGLESLSQIEADIVIASSNNPREASFTPRLIKELKRRKRKIIVIEDKYFNAAQLKHYNGIMTSRPSQYLKHIEVLTSK